MKRVKCSNGVIVTACVGDGFDGSSGIYVDVPHNTPIEKGPFGRDIPEKDLGKVIRLLAWYEKAEMKLRHWEGTMWRVHKGLGDRASLQSTSSPCQAAFYRGHLEAHLKGGR